MRGRLPYRERKPHPAGLLGAGGSLPATTAVDLSSSILTGRGWDLSLSPTVDVFRSGPIVTLSARNVGRSAAAVSYNSLLTLPSAYRPPADVYNESLYARVRITPGGTVSILDPGVTADFFTAIYVTRNPMP